MSPRLSTTVLLVLVAASAWISGLAWFNRSERQKLEQKLEEQRQKKWFENLRQQRLKEFQEQLRGRQS